MEKQRIVVKVGTSTLTHDSGNMDLRNMEHLVRALSDLHGMGHEIILVKSAAITVGTARLGLGEPPRELRMNQAALNITVPWLRFCSPATTWRTQTAPLTCAAPSPPCWKCG